MRIKIDFNSEEALYLQIRNQIILGIAMQEFQDGEILPSVRALADYIGINMHTVNKAYAVLREEGFLKLDRRRGAVISVDADKLEALEELRGHLSVNMAKAYCQHITRDEVHELVDELYDSYEGKEE